MRSSKVPDMIGQNSVAEVKKAPRLPNHSRNNRAVQVRALKHRGSGRLPTGSPTIADWTLRCLLFGQKVRGIRRAFQIV